MRVMIVACALGSVPLIAACTPYAERVARTCDGLGFERGTTEFVECMQTQIQGDAADRVAYLGLIGLGASMMQGR